MPIQMSTPVLNGLIVEQHLRFEAITGLSWAPAYQSVPAQWRAVPVEVLQRVGARGAAALTALCSRLGVASAPDVLVCVALLAVLPRIACAALSGDGADIDPELVEDVAVFGVALLGYNPGLRLELRRRLVELLPAEWRAAIAAAGRIKAGDAPGKKPGKKLRGCARPENAMLRLALLAIAGGAWTPDGLAQAVDLTALERASGWDAEVGRAWRRGLRACVEAVTLASADDVDPVDPRTPLARIAAHLTTSGFARSLSTPRGLRYALTTKGETVERAPRDAAGDVIVPPELADVAEELDNADREILILLMTRAPRLAELVTCERVGGQNPGRVRPATSGNVLRTLDRIAAQYVEAESVLRPLLEARGETWYALGVVTPTFLLSQEVPARLLHIAPPAVRYQDSVEASLVQARAVVVSAEPQVPLLLYLIDRQAPASWANSPEGATGAALAGYTQTLFKDARDLAHAYGRWIATATPKTEPHAAVYSGMRAKAQQVIDVVEVRTAEAGKYKDVAKLLELITWPLLLGPGLEYLRRAVWARLRALEAAAPHRPPAENAEFVDLLEAYLVLAVFCVDPLRFRNVREGCVGREIRLTVDRRGPTGCLLGVQSEITGHEIKQGRRWKRGASAANTARSRTRPRRSHRWPALIIDLDLLWYYLTVVRRSRLPVDDPGARRGPASPSAVPRPLFLSEKTRGDVLGDDAIRDRFAYALHYVCVEALGCDLPPWPEFKSIKGQDWFALFSPHVVRSLVAIYWRVVREHDLVGDQLPAALRERIAAEPPAAGLRRVLGMGADDYVSHLTTDTRRTLDRQYVVRPAWLTAALEEPVDSWPAEERWRHPRALDMLMDLMACATTRVSDVPWSAVPLPPRCRSLPEEWPWS